MELDNLTDEQQELMCELCEKHILGCSPMSATFQCEGAYCNRAIVYLEEELETRQIETAKNHFDIFKYLLI